MQFGFTLKPENSIERTLALTRQAEAAGFEYGWLFDSHVLWRDPYPLLTLMAGVTTTLRLGTCVTNPATREPSVTASTLALLDEISGGRMDLGIGRGDSARRVLGKPPTTMATLEEAIRVIRALVAGETIAYEGTDLHFPWTAGWTLPVWVAGYGPMALAMTGRVADGVILQLADPDLIAWFVSQLREAEVAAGRDPAGSVRVQAAAPAHVGDLADARDTDALVPGARVQPRRRPRQQVPARPAARGPDRLRRRSARATTTCTTPRSGRRTPGSSATRSPTGSACSARSTITREARAPRGRRRRPVQHLPDERRRGAHPRGLRP